MYKVRWGNRHSMARYAMHTMLWRQDYQIVLRITFCYWISWTTVNIDKVFLYVDNRVIHESLFSRQETTLGTLPILFQCFLDWSFFEVKIHNGSLDNRWASSQIKQSPPKSLTLRKDQYARQAQLAETKLRKLSRYVCLFTRS